jgi:spore coat polysaccharide biosynthesis predicted glycosyltransferase SpsG
VINSNIHAFDLDYLKKDCIDYLLGLKYLPLRKEFWEVPEKRIKERVDTIMITFGGEDTKNMTPKILRILRENYPSFKKKVIIGKGFKSLNEIKQECDNNIELIYYPGAKEMLNTMLESDIAISAAGQTLYELARVGVPTIAILVADNQRGNLKGFVEKGFIDNFISWDGGNLEEKVIKAIENLLDKDKRESKNQIGKSIISGNGAKIFVEELLNKFVLLRRIIN